MADYATLDQLVGREADPDTGVTALTGYLGSITDEGTRNQIAEMITRRSRSIDSYLTRGQAINYFAPASDTPSIRILRGTGSDVLILPPHVLGSVSSVTVPLGFSVPTYLETIDGLITVETGGIRAQARSKQTIGTIRLSSGCDDDYYSSYRGEDTATVTNLFQAGVPYSITALWGFEPESIVLSELNEACIQWVVRTFRGKDEAFSGAIESIQRDGTILDRGMPVAVKEILDRYTNLYVPFETFFG